MSQGATEQLTKKAGTTRSLTVGWNDVQVRPFAEKDIDPFLDYLFRSQRDLPAIQMIDFDKFPKEQELRKTYYDQLREGPPFVAVEYHGRTIGLHLLNGIQGNQADFHAHFWATDARGKGIGPISWYKACRYFFDNISTLNTIFFRTPKNNPFSLSLAKKLPLKYIGEEELVSPILKPGIFADVFALTRSEFESLHNEDSDADDDEDLDEID